MILFILGPSGVGKSTFARYLSKEHHWFHLEIDDPRGDGIDIYGLRRAWDAFYLSTSPSLLAQAVRDLMKKANASKCVVSFPSPLVLSPDHIDAAARESIRVTYLYATAAQCIDAFLQRERESMRNLSLDHWLGFNKESYIAMSRPEFRPHRINVFEAGGRRSNADILRDLMQE